MSHMKNTQHLSYEDRYEFDIVDRLRRAMRISGKEVAELANELEVHPNTVSNWINGRHAPRDYDLKRFASATGFKPEWLRNGTLPPERNDRTKGGHASLHFRSSQANVRPSVQKDALITPIRHRHK